MGVSTIQTCSNVQFWAPAAANPVSVTPSGTAWTSSAWVQLLASVSAAALLTAIHVGTMGTVAGGLSFEFDLGVGGAGSEVVVATLPGSNGVNSDFWATGTLRFPVPVDKVPNGSRLAVRMRKTGTDTTAWAFAVGYFKKPLASAPVPIETSTQTPFVQPSAAIGTVLAAAGGASAAWANGVWATVIVNPLSDAVVLGYALDWMGNGKLWEVDLAIGAAGAEVLVHTVRAATIVIPGDACLVMHPNPLDFVRAGVRVAARQRASVINNTNTTGIKLCLMNKPL